MEFFDIIQFENFTANREIKIGILALFANVFVGLARLIVGIPASMTGSLSLLFILIVLQTIAFVLLLLFGIGLIYLGKLFENETGLWAGITFIIVHVSSYLNVYLYIFPAWVPINLFNGVFVYLTMFLLIFFFLLNISKKYEEPIILIAGFTWIAATLLNMFLVYVSAWATQIPLMIRDFITAWAFALIITKEEGSEKSGKLKDRDYRHVKVKYDSDE